LHKGLRFGKRKRAGLALFHRCGMVGREGLEPSTKGL
jgi:hypothetical protein